MKSYTAFDTPVVTAVLHRLASVLLAISGWKVSGQLPEQRKYVMVAAPHTSNWDLPVLLVIAFALRAKISWMGKRELFRWPFGGFFRWFGGIPIDRSRAHNTVAQTVEIFRQRESFALVVAPEGTRKRVAYWKSGFYHIAHGAQVPIVLGFLDYRRKVGGMGPTILPSGDIERDMATMRDFYSGISGKHYAEYAAELARTSDAAEPLATPGEE